MYRKGIDLLAQVIADTCKRHSDVSMEDVIISQEEIIESLSG